MTPTERAEWCKREADSIEREQPPREEETLTIGHCVADWLTDQSGKLQRGAGDDD